MNTAVNEHFSANVTYVIYDGSRDLCGATMNDEQNGSVSRLIDQLKEGNEQATAKIWARYQKRLVNLARRKLRNATKRVSDEDDVAQSAFYAFFERARDGKFASLFNRDELWHILATITARKAVDTIKHSFRKKRGNGELRGHSVFMQLDPTGAKGGFDQFEGTEPSAEMAAEVAEACQQLVAALGSEELEAIAMWKQAGYSNEEIASKLDRDVRTVERKLNKIREKWASQIT